jgi:hypothetical protein
MTTPENHRVVTLGYDRGNDLWPFTLLEGAKSFLRIADHAVAQMAPIKLGSSDHLAILFVLGQSLELSLKTFLRFRGKSEEELVKLDHELTAIFDAAVREGFPAGHPCDRKLLNLLQLTYAGKRELQYQRAGATGVPFMRPVRELVAEYIVIASNGQWQPEDHASDYGCPSLSELRKHSNGTDLRQLALGWIASAQPEPASRGETPARDSPHAANRAAR